MPQVLFVCVHNSGRSQMAKAIFNRFAEEAGIEFRADSAGTAPSAFVNPAAAEAMAEIGVPIADAKPKRLTPEMAISAERMITMGCGVDADACPAGTHFTEDWGLDDPAGQSLEGVRVIRDEIIRRVNRLVESMR